MINKTTLSNTLTSSLDNNFIEKTREKLCCIDSTFFGQKVWHVPRALKPLRSLVKRFFYVKEVDDAQFKKILLSSLQILSYDPSVTPAVKKLANRQIIILTNPEIQASPLLIPSRVPSMEELEANRLKEEQDLLEHSLLDDLTYTTGPVPDQDSLKKAFSGDYAQELLISQEGIERKKLLESTKATSIKTDAIVKLGMSDENSGKKELRKLSIDMSSQCTNLNDSESMVIPFEIISKQQRIKDLAASHLPQPLLQLLDDNPNPTPLLDLFYKEFTLDLTPKESQILKDLLERDLYSRLPSSIQDKIPDAIRKRLPTIFTTNLTTLIIDPLKGILSEDQISAFQEKITTHGLKKALLTVATPYLTQAFSMRNRAMDGAFSTLFSSMPSMASDILAYKGFVPTSQKLLMEFTKHGSTIDITLFSTICSRGLIKIGDEPQTVFKFTSVPIEKVDQEFFLNALTFKAFPSWDLSELSSFDFYNKCLQPLDEYLEASPEGENITPLLLKDTYNSDFLETRYLLHGQFKSQNELLYSRYKMRFDYFLSYTRALINEGKEITETQSLQFKAHKEMLLADLDTIELYTAAEKLAIKATLCDIDKKLCLTKEKMTTDSLPKALSLLPPMIHSTLGMMLSTLGYSEEQLLIIRDTFSQTFGHEYAPFFDSALRELAASLELSQTDGSQSTTLISLDDSFKENVQRLSHVIYQEITNQLFVSSFTILSMILDYASISFTTIPWTILKAVSIRYHHIILEKILPKELFELYTNVLLQVQTFILSHGARIFVSYFFTVDQQEDLKHTIDSFLQDAFSQSTKDFSLKTDIQSPYPTLSTTHSFGKVDDLHEAKNPKESSAIPTFESPHSKNIQDMQHQALSKEPFETQTQKTDAIMFLTDALQNSKKLQENNLHLEAAKYAMKALQAIPTPIKGPDPFFDQFNSSLQRDQFIKQIVELSFLTKYFITEDRKSSSKLRGIPSSDDHYSDFFSPLPFGSAITDTLNSFFHRTAAESPSRASLIQRFPTFMVNYLEENHASTHFCAIEMEHESILTAWHCLAITEALARKNIPELGWKVQNKGFYCDINQYRRWLEDKKGLILSPQAHLVLEKVCDYYEIDRTEKISLEDLPIDRLFTAKVGEQLLPSSRNRSSFMTPYGKQTPWSSNYPPLYLPSDQRLYKLLAKRADFQEKIAPLKLTDDEALCYLITDGWVDEKMHSPNDTSRTSVLPYSIIALREMVGRLPRNKWLDHSSFYPISRMIQVPTWKLYSSDNEPPLAYMQDTKPKKKGVLFQDLNMPRINPLRKNEGEWVYSSDEMELLDFPLDNTPQEQALRVMSVFSNKTDQVSRALSYLEDQPPSFKHSSRFNLIMLNALLQGGALHLQLQTQPELAYNIAELLTIPFIKSLFNNNHTEYNEKFCIELLEKIQDLCLFHCPESIARFDLVKFNMAKVATEPGLFKESIKDKLHLQFLANYSEIDPEEIQNPQLKRQIILSLAYICFTHGSKFFDENPYDSTSFYQSLMTFKRWEGILIESLNHNPRLLNRVASLITSRKPGVLLPSNPLDWKGSFPHFTCDTLSLDFSEGTFFSLHRDESSVLINLINQYHPQTDGVLVQKNKCRFYDTNQKVTYVCSDQNPPSLHVEKSIDGVIHHLVLTTPKFPGIDLKRFDVWQSTIDPTKLHLLSCLNGESIAVITTNDDEEALSIISINIQNKKTLDLAREPVPRTHSSLYRLFQHRGLSSTFYASLTDPSSLEQIRLDTGLNLSIQDGHALCTDEPSLEGFELSQTSCPQAEEFFPSALHFTSLQDPSQRKLLISNSNALVALIKGKLNQFIPSLQSKFSAPLIHTLLSSLDEGKSQAMVFSFNERAGITSDSVDGLIYLLLNAIACGYDLQLDILSKKLKSLLTKEEVLSSFSKYALTLINFISLTEEKYLPLAIRLNLLANETTVLRGSHTPPNPSEIDEQFLDISSSIAIFYTWSQRQETPIFPLSELEEYNFLRALKKNIISVASPWLDLNPSTKEDFRSMAHNRAKDEIRDSIWSCILPFDILTSYMKSEMKYEHLSLVQVMMRHKMRFIMEIEDSSIPSSTLNTMFGKVSTGLQFCQTQAFSMTDRVLGTTPPTFGIDKRSSFPLQLLAVQEDSNKLSELPKIQSLFSFREQYLISSFNRELATDFLALSEDHLLQNFYDYYRLAFRQPPKEIKDDAALLSNFYRQSDDFRYSMQRFTGKTSKTITFFIKLFTQKPSSAPQLDTLIATLQKYHEKIKSEDNTPYLERQVGKKIRKWNSDVFSLTEGHFQDYCSLTYHGILKPLASIMTTQVGMKKVLSTVTGISSIFPGVFIQGSKTAFNYVTKVGQITHSLEQGSRKESSSIYRLGHIDEFDYHSEAQCKDLHDIFFTTEVIRKTDMRDTDGLSEAMKKDLEAYYRENPHHYKHSLIEGKDPHQLGSTLFTLQEALHVSIVTRENLILAQLNSSRRRSKDRPITMSDLDNIALSNNPEAIIQRITTLQNSEIEGILETYLLMKAEITRHSTLINTLCLVEESLATDDPIVRKKIFHLIGERLLQQRGYRFSDPTYPREVKQSLLLFEASSGFMLWPHQPLLVLKAYQDEGKITHRTIEAIMGTGKSAVVIPLASKTLGRKAEGESRGSFTINIFPEPIFEEASQTLITTARDHLGQQINTVVIDETTQINDQWLHTFYLLLIRCIENGEALVMTKESLQSLESNYVKILYDRNPSTSDGFLEKYARVLNLIHTKATFNVDEAHDTFYQGKELNTPLGRQQKIPDEAIDISALCMTSLYQLTSVNDFLVSLSHNKQSQEDQKLIYEHRVKKELFLRLSEHKHFCFNSSEKTAFLKFVHNPSLPLPTILRDHPDLQDIMLARGIINQILPETLSQLINVDFASANGNIDFALPASGSHKPEISSRLINPYETLIKTFLNTVYNGLSEERQIRFYYFLTHCAKAEGKDLDTTPTGRIFASWFGGRELSTTSLTAFMALLKRKPAAPIIWFVQHSSAHQIRYFAENIRNGSEIFQTMPQSLVSYTGSPYNVDTFTEKTKFHSDDTTKGHTLHELLKSAEVTTFDDSRGHLIERLISDYLSRDSSIRAIIDLGALFSLPGFTNEYLAKKMLNAIQTRDDLDGIVYFDSTSGKLYILEKGRPRPIPLSKSMIPPSRRLTFYDHVHRLAADVSQQEGAKAIATIGVKTELDRDIAQGVWRMRGLGKSKKDQSIIFALPKSLETTISTQHPCTVTNILDFAAKNQEASRKNNNYAADSAKITATIKRALLNKLSEQTSGYTIRSLFREFSSVLIDPLQVTPSILYGGIKTTVDPRDTFIEHKTTLLKIVLKSRAFTIREKQRLREKLGSIGIDSTRYPAQVPLYTNDGKKIPTSGFGESQRLSAEQTQDLKSTDEIENEQIEKMVNQLTQTQTARVVNLGTIAVKAFDWSKSFDIHDTKEWLQFASLDKQMNFAYLLGRRPSYRGSSEMPLYEISDVLQQSSSERQRSLSALFSDVSVFMSHNFAPLSHTEFDLFGIYRKPMQEVLIVSIQDSHGREKLSLGLLDSDDLETWHKKIAAAKSTTSATKIAIYNPTLRRVIETTDPQLSSAVIDRNQAISSTLTSLDLLFGKNFETKKEEIKLEEFLKEQFAHLQSLSDVWLESYENRHTERAETTRTFSIFHRLKEAEKKRLLEEKVKKAFAITIPRRFSTPIIGRALRMKPATYPIPFPELLSTRALLSLLYPLTA